MNNRPSKTAAQDCDGSDRCAATEHLHGCFYARRHRFVLGATGYDCACGASRPLDYRGEPIKILSATATARGIEAQFQIKDPAVLDRIRSGDVGSVSVSGRDLYEAIHALQQPEPIRAEAPKPTVYIAGPMTGHQDFNYHAFHYAATDLRAAGHTVLNPAENPKPNPNPTWQDWMRVALGQLIQADAIALLPGWHLSRGAKVERALAEGLGLQVLHIQDYVGDKNSRLYFPSASSK